MSQHYRTYSAVFPMIFREVNQKKQILLHKRRNTGYMDGMWDFAGSGHVDENETAIQALVRECFEELNIVVETKDVEFAHLSHRVGKNGVRTYYDLYFLVNHFKGEPIIAEPEKSDALAWFDLEALPSDMIEIRQQVLLYYLKSVTYSETLVEPQ